MRGSSRRLAFATHLLKSHSHGAVGWKAPGSANSAFGGKKVLALVWLFVCLGLTVLLALTPCIWTNGQRGRIKPTQQPMVAPDMLAVARAAMAATADCANCTGDAALRDLRSSVVKIFNTRQKPNWFVPWQAKHVESSTGSGAVIRVSTAGSQFLGVLTAAHVVADTRFLQIQRSSDRFSGDKFAAKVVAVCHEADVALMVVADPTALEEITPLELAPADYLPRISDKVRVVGYPVGGDACSVTEGTVTRVEVQDYAHAFRRGLAITVDAAINAGNSGGPVIDSLTSQVLGVAIQKMVANGVELQGRAVPSPLIWRFLNEAANHMSNSSSSNVTYRMSLPSLACMTQPLESKAMRRSLGLADGKSGLFIPCVYGDAPTALHEGDVLLAFEGKELDSQGYTEVLGQRLAFQAARDLCAVGQDVNVTVWRDGREETLQHTLAPSQILVPRGQYDVLPQFFICGGLVFQPLSHEWMHELKKAPPHLTTQFLGGWKTAEVKELVVLTQVLQDHINEGFGSGYIGAPLITAVNGQPIRDLRHLIRCVEQERSNNTVRFLEFSGETAHTPLRVVLPLEGLDEAERRIAQIYKAPSRSQHFA